LKGYLKSQIEGLFLFYSIKGVCVVAVKKEKEDGRGERGKRE